MNIYLIAEPPGVGKSTNARKLVPKKAPIIDQDLAGYQYKKLGFGNYRDLASMNTNLVHVRFGFDRVIEGEHRVGVGNLLDKWPHDLPELCRVGGDCE